jgi:hypothetical protein
MIKLLGETRILSNKMGDLESILKVQGISRISGFGIFFFRKLSRDLT